MNKNLKYLIAFTGIIVLGIASYLFLTPQGALRFAMVRAGYPLEAITINLTDVEITKGAQDNQIDYTLANFETNIEGESSLWSVLNAGILYWGRHDGWITYPME